MRLALFAAAGPLQFSLDWDETERLLARPALDRGQSRVHRAWTLRWLRGSVRVDVAKARR